MPAHIDAELEDLRTRFGRMGWRSGRMAGGGVKLSRAPRVCHAQPYSLSRTEEDDLAALFSRCVVRPRRRGLAALTALIDLDSPGRIGNGLRALALAAEAESDPPSTPTSPQMSVDATENVLRWRGWLNQTA
eukprot:Hpha_TRINITY_DN14960_c0_g1::TRINITY_DN14960_c0_g1_i1::g.143245::m.143245